MSLKGMKFKSHRYALTLPVSKRQIKYRPWTVREENALLMAKKAGSPEAIADAVANIVDLVTESAVSAENDAVIDVLYTFLLSRARAAGEIAHVSYACEKCDGGTVNATVNYSEIKIDVPDVENEIELGETESGDKIWVKLKPLSFTSFMTAKNAAVPDAHLFKSCVEKMYTDEAVIDVESNTDADWEEFYLSLPVSSLKSIEGWFSRKPTAKTVAKGVCASCKRDSEKTIEGVSDFT